MASGWVKLTVGKTNEPAYFNMDKFITMARDGNETVLLQTLDEKISVRVKESPDEILKKINANA